MHNVISAQMYKCFKTKGFYILLMIALLSTVFDLIKVTTTLQSNPELKIEGFTSTYDALSGGMFLLLVGIYAALVFSSDYTSLSIRQIIGKGTKRTAYILGSLLTVTVVSLIISSAAYVAAFLRGTFIGSGTGTFDGLMMIRFLVVIIVFGFMYVAFTALIANITRKTSLTMLISIFTPTILQLVAVSITSLAKIDVLYDPITMMDVATSVKTSTQDYLIAVIIYFCAGILLTYMSIIVGKKKDL